MSTNGRPPDRRAALLALLQQRRKRAERAAAASSPSPPMAIALVADTQVCVVPAHGYHLAGEPAPRATEGFSPQMAKNPPAEPTPPPPVSRAFSEGYERRRGLLRAFGEATTLDAIADARERLLTDGLRDDGPPPPPPPPPPPTLTESLAWAWDRRGCRRRAPTRCRDRRAPCRLHTAHPRARVAHSTVAPSLSPLVTRISCARVREQFGDRSSSLLNFGECRRNSGNVLLSHESPMKSRGKQHARTHSRPSVSYYALKFGWVSPAAEVIDAIGGGSAPGRRRATGGRPGRPGASATGESPSSPRPSRRPRPPDRSTPRRSASPSTSSRPEARR